MTETDTISEGSVDKPPRAKARHWLTVFLAAFALYGITANRGPQWQDGGHQVLRIVTGELHNPLGLALVHPLHHWIGRLAIAPGIGDPAFVITLISAFFGAITVANVFMIVRLWSGHTGAAIFAAATLGISHTFWQLATKTETYTLCTALISTEFMLLLCWIRTQKPKYLCGLALANGLGIANHLLASLLTPVWVGMAIYLLIRRRISVKTVIAATLLCVAGTMPYTLLIVGQALNSGDLIATIRSALFGQAWADDVLNTSISAERLAMTAAFVGYSFPGFMIPLAVAGLLSMRKVSKTAVVSSCLLGGLVIHAVFALRYSVVDQHTFLLPFYLLVCIAGGMGFAHVQSIPSRPGRRAILVASVVFLLFTPVLYATFPGIARQKQILKKFDRNNPYRDDYVYIFTPWSVADDSAEILAEHAVKLARPNGLIVVEDGMAKFAIEYERIRSDLRNVDVVVRADAETIMAAVREGRTVVLAPANAENPTTEAPVGKWVRDGDIFRLNPRGLSNSPT